MFYFQLEEPDEGCIRPSEDVYCFLAGDPRVNEQTVPLIIIIIIIVIIVIIVIIIIITIIIIATRTNLSLQRLFHKK